MTWTMLAFVVLMMLFGGALAYGSDWLGRKLGKQRLTLFGVRPRHTATLLTTLTGVLTVALTIAILTALNESFRVWITRGDRILYELRENEARLQSLRERTEQLISERKRLEEERAKAEAELLQVKAQYEQQLQKAQQLEQELNATRARLSASQQTLKSVQKQVIDLQRVREDLQNQTESLRKEIADLQVFQERLREQNKDFTEYNIRVTQENIQLENRNRALAEENQQLEARNRELQQQNDDLETQNKILLDRSTEYRLRLTQLESAVRDLVQLANIRLQPVAFQIGEELARTTLPANWSEFRIRQALQDLLNKADQFARQRGARASDAPRAVFIPEKRVRLASGEEVTVDEVESLDTIVTNIRNYRDSVVALVVALTNTAEGEPVPVEIRLFRNHKVFSAGQEVARTTLECRGEQDVLAQVLQFLRGSLRQSAIEAGMVPRVEQADTPPTIGETAPHTLAEILEQARRCRTPRVVLIAYAQKDTYAGDSLQLRFEVLPEGKAGTQRSTAN